MVSVESERPGGELLVPTPVKIVIAGGFGTGKTTMVNSVSEIPPLHTEELLTEAGVGVDDVLGLESKETTTVALDFGRITINPEVVLYLFGTPGQNRFWFMWDELAYGAIGAVILVDTRRLDSSFPSIDFFERRGIPFIIAVNCFEGAHSYEVDEVRRALDVDAAIPLVLCDARDRESAKTVLVSLIKHTMDRLDAMA
ncbi:signal recognition particle receptor subunit beta [Saccharothrix carnea]|uniref:Signal recognition particle receptor subunit beta n=1 Tax=Saccharothrix carnea TaxID=1280637 RepID=A0A2P8I4P4_SACCR|nr:ATP/GTP-binding protein [Saccharothrix carnea]PSL53431.1 signal recognition particle receptor subunit beta [Saccharothrix carnea]